MGYSMGMLLICTDVVKTNKYFCVFMQHGYSKQNQRNIQHITVSRFRLHQMIKTEHLDVFLTQLPYVYLLYSHFIKMKSKGYVALAKSIFICTNVSIIKIQTTKLFVSK